MYFLWKITPRGSIRVSRDGLAEIMSRILSAKSKLSDLVLEGGDKASVMLVISSSDEASDKLAEEQLSFIAAPLGLSVRVVWVDKTTPADEKLLFFKKPGTWMLFVSAVTLVYIAGWSGFFWTMFSGTVAWFAAYFTSCIFRRKKFSGLTATLRR